MPELIWKGKEAVKNYHLNAPIRTLNKQYHYGDESENMIIHGDNLEALKALLPSYEGKFKCVYIDPPYNTGSENWIYNDNMNSPTTKKWLAKVVGDEANDFNRHDKWLCMMYPRLQLLKKLLADDGAIFISIDDNEYANLKIICDDIFETRNYITTLHVEMSTTQGMKVMAAQKGEIVKNGELILVYAKKESAFSFYKILYNSKSWDDHYSIYIERETNTRKTLLEFLREDEKYREISKNQIERLYNLDDKFRNYIHSISDNIYRDAMISVEIDLNEEQKSELNNGKIIEFQKYLIFKTTTGVIRQLLSLKDAIGETDDFEARFGFRKIRGDWWSDFYKDMMNINKEGNLIFKNGKKPVRLIQQLLKICTSGRSLILDSFAGSGTTAHAVLNLNKADGGNRHFVLIEMEDYAESITAERVRRVISGYGKGDKAVAGTGGGFGFYELGEPIFLEGGILNEDLPIAKLREYIFYSETRENLPSASSNTNKYYLGGKNGVDYYFYYEKGETTTLDHDFLFMLSQKAEQYVIYADNCLLSAEYMLKHNISFKKIPRDICML